MKNRNRQRRVRPDGYVLAAGLGVLLGSMLLMGADGGSSSDEVRQKITRDIVEAIEKVAQKEEKPFEAFSEDDASEKDLAARRQPLPEPNPNGGDGRTVLVIDLHETIDMGLSAFVDRTIRSYPDAAAVIFDINTPGGRVDAATKIRDLIMDLPDTMRSVAYVHPRAISAGAFIAFACDFIFFADGGSMGAATPVSIDGGGMSAAGEKVVSYFRAEMASTARAKGRSGRIAAAMVDADIEIEGLTPKGKLLTLDTHDALKHGVADDRVSSLADIQGKIAMPLATLQRQNMNWAERLARILTDPVLTGILMSIGMLGILIELYQPGFGLPGIVGVTALLIFFAGHLVVHMAGMEEVVLFVIGVALLVLEMYVIPGFGVPGVLGILAIIISLVMSLSGLPIQISWSTGIFTDALFRVMLSLLATMGMFVATLMVLPKRAFFRNRMVLETAITGTASGGVEGAIVAEVASAGAVGVAESYLRPSGIGRFGHRRVDVITEGDFVEKGASLKVIRTEGNRVIVRRTDPS